MISEQDPNDEAAVVPSQPQAGDEPTAADRSVSTTEPQPHSVVGDADPEGAAQRASETPASADADIDGPSVDELEGRLGEVERSMGHLQSGDLDDAEVAIASLDQRTTATSD